MTQSKCNADVPRGTKMTFGDKASVVRWKCCTGKQGDAEICRLLRFENFDETTTTENEMVSDKKKADRKIV